MPALHAGKELTLEPKGAAIKNAMHVIAADSGQGQWFAWTRDDQTINDERFLRTITFKGQGQRGIACGFHLCQPCRAKSGPYLVEHPAEIDCPGPVLRLRAATINPISVDAAINQAALPGICRHCRINRRT